MVKKEKKIIYLYGDKKEKSVKINKKNIKQIGIEEETNKIYDLTSIKKKNPIILGKLNKKNGKMIV